jgi:Holliday junction resolvasome RuvABC endonuclease subunit
MKMIVAGMDPSMSNWGIARMRVCVQTLSLEIEGLALIATESETKKQVSKTSDDLRRAREVREGMLANVSDCAVVISEIPFYNPAAYPMANFNSGLCAGVLASCPVPVIQVSPQDVKLAAVGHRQAAKEEMIEWAMATYPTAPWLMRKFKGTIRPTAANEHLADAVATVHAGIKTEQFKQALTLYRSMLRSAA